MLKEMLSAEAKKTNLNPALVVIMIVLIWLGYADMQTSYAMGGMRAELYAIIGFFPGILGVAVLFTAGLSRQDCYLQVRRLSRMGFVVLAAIFIIGLAVVLPFGEWQGWNWKAALLFAPASGISQELFFRSALLPAMGLLFKGRIRLALIAHSLLFSLWHIAPLFLGAPA
jgi:membrane protease YdiL (CAAX protease family)